jgi:hypothetical protein
VPAPPFKEKAKPDVEACDKDLTKPIRARKKSVKPTVRKIWVEKPWEWTERQQASFEYVK